MSGTDAARNAASHGHPIAIADAMPFDAILPVTIIYPKKQRIAKERVERVGF